MKGIAQIRFQGGGIFLPVKTPYEREVLFEYADQCAKRHGQVRLEVGRHECTVSSRTDIPVTCAECTERLDHLSYAFGGRTLCRFCARQALN